MLLCEVSLPPKKNQTEIVVNEETAVGVVQQLIIAAQVAKQLMETVQLRLVVEAAERAPTDNAVLLLVLAHLMSAAH